MQIVTGIEVNSEAYLPKLRKYCPSAEVTAAHFDQSHRGITTLYCLTPAQTAAARSDSFQSAAQQEEHGCVHKKLRRR